MSLTGTGFVSLLVALFLAAFAAVVWRWPALGGPGPRRVATRVVVLLALHVLLLATVLVGVNAKYLFYASWRDLGNSVQQQQDATLVDRGQAASAAAGTALGTPGTGRRDGTAPAALPSGTRTYRVHGTRSGITAPVIVDLPPGYAAGVRSGRTYPVLETFGGYPSSPAQWLRSMQLRRQLSAGAAGSRVGQAVIVSPAVELPAGRDTECVNGGRGNPAVETWVADDVPAWVQRTFAVTGARSGWATIGLSAGAWCAAMTTMLHPQQFSAAIVMGGYLRADFGPAYRPFAAGSALGRRYDLVALARHRPPPVALWLETSAADRLSYPSSAELIRTARAPLSVTAVVLPDAGHRISVWKHLLPQAVGWLGAEIPGFRPAGAATGTATARATTRPDGARQGSGVAATSVRAMRA